MRKMNKKKTLSLHHSCPRFTTPTASTAIVIKSLESYTSKKNDNVMVK